jgi:hypothetical protein
MCSTLRRARPPLHRRTIRIPEMEIRQSNRKQVRGSKTQELENPLQFVVGAFLLRRTWSQMHNYAATQTLTTILLLAACSSLSPPQIRLLFYFDSTDESIQIFSIFNKAILLLGCRPGFDLSWTNERPAILVCTAIKIMTGPLEFNFHFI